MKEETVEELTQALFESGPGYNKENCQFVAKAVYDVFESEFSLKIEDKKEKLSPTQDLGLDSFDFMMMIFDIEDNLNIGISDELIDKYRALHGNNLSVFHILQMGYEAKYGVREKV